MKRSTMSSLAMLAGIAGLFGVGAIAGPIQGRKQKRSSILIGQSRDSRTPDQQVDALKAAEEKRARKRAKRAR